MTAPGPNPDHAMLDYYTKEELLNWDVETLAAHILDQQDELTRKLPQVRPFGPTSMARTYPEKYESVLRKVRIAMKQSIEVQMRVQRAPPSGTVKAWAFETFVPTLEVIDEIFNMQDEDDERGWKCISLKRFARICSWDLTVSIHVDEPAPLIVKGDVRLEWDKVAHNFVVYGTYGFESFWNHK